MLGSIYTALAGMNAYSRGLDVISNNVANLNTPGFKVSDPLFREIVYQHLNASAGRGFGLHPEGAGVEAGATSIMFKQGELRDTGNPLDAALDGSGFFVLEKDGAYLYTRAGQFEFNDDGILVERGTGARVMISTTERAIGSFDINTARTHDPRATTTVTLSGTLARGGTATTHEVPNITVYDAAGTAITLRARFVRNATEATRWTVEVLNPAGTVIGSGAIQFAANGTPAADASQFTVTVESESSEDFDVTFTMGAAGTFANVTSPAASTTSQVQVLRQDGLRVGSLTKMEFDDRGQLKLTYTNGETRAVGSLVLAQFNAPEQLVALGSGMFAAPESVAAVFGGALQNGFGKVVGAKLEMSNVELTQQFTDLIIMQRGYQASSQISSVANELIQTLLAMDGRR